MKDRMLKNAEILAEKYGADKEVVLIAAWLHDIASITDYSLYDLHHRKMMYLESSDGITCKIALCADKIEPGLRASEFSGGRNNA